VSESETTSDLGIREAKPEDEACAGIESLSLWTISWHWLNIFEIFKENDFIIKCSKLRVWALLFQIYIYKFVKFFSRWSFSNVPSDGVAPNETIPLNVSVVCMCFIWSSG